MRIFSGVMRINCAFAWICLMLLLCLVCGCDIGRLRMYKLSFPQQGGHHFATGVMTEDEKRLKRLIQETLEREGFEEQLGKLGRWYKKGVWVELIRDEKGKFILKVWAFGGRQELRLAEQTERRLLAILTQEDRLHISPMPGSGVHPYPDGPY